MKRQQVAVIAAIAMAVVCLPVRANDSAASVGVGGIVLTREPRVSMEKERLTISLKKVTVEYEFLNTSAQDISTEVAFPIPAYKNDEGAGGVRSFNDFKLWVEGKPLAYQTEAKAFVDGKDVTAELAKYGLDVTTLGHFTDNSKGVSSDFMKLTAEQKKQGVAAGLFLDMDGGFPAWEVRKTFHWTQNFPAGKVLHVKHAYVPAFGFQLMEGGMFDAAAKSKLAADKDHAESFNSDDALIGSACVDPALAKTLYARSSAAAQAKSPNGDYVETQWVDYIVTTANSWKTPIKNFQLILEKATPDEFVSLCWDGSLQKVDALRFEADAKDFVPAKELRVVFFDVGK